ncbi:hypothetical protein [Roseateles sp.]|uniref:hypothetical protein n=1 Tax=Roseateles sp. TaxID=1971397 RepID=UPI0039647FD1
MLYRQRWWLLPLSALLLLSLLLSAPARAEPAQALRWMVQESPPHFNFVNGRPPATPEELDTGSVGRYLRQLLGRLPGYRVEFVEANASRVEQQARQGETFCATQIKRTPQRLQWLYFTPLFPVLAGEEFRLVLRADLAARISPEGQRPSLAELLNQSGLRVQVAVGRSFNPAIDALLALHEVPRVQLDSRQSRRLLELVRGGRIDMTIEYGSIVRRFLGGRDAADGVTSLAFVEHQTPFDVMVACTRNAGGRAAIEAIDAAVREIAREGLRAPWVSAWREGGADAAALKRLQAYLDERAKGGPRID